MLAVAQVADALRRERRGCRVRIPPANPTSQNGAVAQMEIRAPGRLPGGREFESRQLRQLITRRKLNG